MSADHSGFFLTHAAESARRTMHSSSNPCKAREQVAHSASSSAVPGTDKPLRRGGFRALDKTPATPPVQVQIIQDDGIGGTLAGSNGTITSVLNYTTTLATPQTVTLTPTEEFKTFPPTPAPSYTSLLLASQVCCFINDAF